MKKTHFYLEAKNQPYGLFRERYTQLSNAIQFACRNMCLAIGTITIYRVEGDYFQNPETYEFKHRRPNRRVKVAELDQEGNITKFNDDSSIKSKVKAPDFVLKALLLI